MQLQTLTRAQLLQAGQQEVMQNTSYIPPRRNIAYSTLPHTNAATFFFSEDTVGVLQNPPKSAGNDDPIDGDAQAALPVSYDPIPDPGDQSQQLSGLRQTRATLSINNDVLTISDSEVTQNIYINGTEVPERT